MDLDEAREAVDEAGNAYAEVAKGVGEEHPSALAAWAVFDAACEVYAQALADVTIGRL